jgi:GntR family transcriptional regulator, carbon starvation induced regulator
MDKSANARDSGLVLSEQAHQKIKRDILNGSLLPGAKLRLDAISERYDIGQAPVREALNQLSAEGLVARRSQKGFFVSELSISDLEDLVKARIWIETRALSESIAKATTEWDNGLILAYHRLARTRRLMNEADVDSYNAEWEVRHDEFHLQLISQCGSSWMVQFCSTMMDQSVRYRNLSVNYTLARRGDALAEHEELLNVALDRNSDLACELLTAHYRKTLQGLKEMFSKDSLS